MADSAEGQACQSHVARVSCTRYVSSHVLTGDAVGAAAEDGLGNMQSANYTPKDILWGELGGCLEAIDGGTTTIFDHAHMNYSPEHSMFASTFYD